MKDWYKNGDRPPVGEMVIADYFKGLTPSDLDRFIGNEVRICAHFETVRNEKGVVIEHKNHGVGAVMFYEKTMFKPIDEDRDKAIEMALNCFRKDNGFNSIADQLKIYAGLWYDAGLLRAKE